MFAALGATVTGVPITWAAPEKRLGETELMPVRKPRPPRLVMIDPGHGVIRALWAAAGHRKKT